MQSLRIDWIFLILLIILTLANNAEAGTPVVSISASVSPSEIVAGSSGTLTVVISETGGNDWIKNPTVLVQTSSTEGISFSQTSKTVSKIDKYSSNTFYFSFNTEKTVSPDMKNIEITLEYYEMDLLNIRTYGPYYKYATVSFNILPSVGSIYIISTPSSAEVNLDGSYKGITPITIPSISTGSHTVVLKKSGYNEVSKTINVEYGQTTSISETLILLTGSISVSSNPNGADVYLDGNYEGSTPITIPNVPIGSRTVVLKKSGYNEVSKTINVEYGQTTSISETLILLTGSISVSSNPNGADVYLDGNYKGSTPITIPNVPIGSRTVVLKKSSYHEISKTVDVKYGQTTTVSETMVLQTGSIKISSDPIGAEIYFDGTYKGLTPITITSVPVGTHTVVLKKFGYADWTQSVDTLVDRTVEINHSMVIFIFGSLDAYSSDALIFFIIGLGAILIIGTFLIRKSKKSKQEVIARSVELKGTSISSHVEEQPQESSPKKPDAKDEISIKSAYEYKGAKIYYKIRVENNSSEAISDIKLHLFVPDVFLLKEKEKSLSMLEPKESQTVTFEIRPTGECGDCNISGKLEYYDYAAKGRKILDIGTKSVSVICPVLKRKEIDLKQWEQVSDELIKAEENIKELSVPAENLFNITSRVIKDSGMFMLKPEITSTPQLFNGVAMFYAEGVTGLRYAAFIEVVGGARKSRMILKVWAEKEEALTGFYHRILDEIEKRIDVKIFIDDAVVQQNIHIGDRIGSQVKDSVVQRSNIGGGARKCPECGREVETNEKFCPECGARL